MNYAERCRAEARRLRGKARTSQPASVAALLDAAAGLWEAGDGIRDQMAEAMAAADAAAHELEESLYAAMASADGKGEHAMSTPHREPRSGGEGDRNG